MSSLQAIATDQLRPNSIREAPEKLAISRFIKLNLLYTFVNEDQHFISQVENTL
ncbi:hypothetical protein [Actinophytocola sp.]|uniref:hypothetical protein n=1 Tax=Actinophytocola sp. TaxID=1872138 RepID=UPI00389B0F97